MPVKLLDVSLRDGGYRNGFDFSLASALDVVSGLFKSGLDYIEIGYRNGYEGGVTAKSDDHYISMVRESVPDAELCVMLRACKATEADVRSLHSLGIKLVRIAFPPKYQWQHDPTSLDKAFHLVGLCKRQGLMVSSNFIQISYLEEDLIINLAQRAEESGTDIVYLADSNGSLLPEQVKEYIVALKSVLRVKVGFHAHNNLSLALTNALAAIDGGVDFIDASLRGYGRAAGNLSTELFISYLEKRSIPHTYDLMRILALAELWENQIVHEKMSLTTKDILFGTLNFSSPEFNKELDIIAENEHVPWYDLAYILGQATPEFPNTEQICTLAKSLKKITI